MEIASIYTNMFGTYEQTIFCEDDGMGLLIKYNGEILYAGRASRIEDDHYEINFIDDKGEKRKFNHGTFITTG